MYVENIRTCSTYNQYCIKDSFIQGKQINTPLAMERNAFSKEKKKPKESQINVNLIKIFVRAGNFFIKNRIPLFNQDNKVQTSIPSRKKLH